MVTNGIELLSSETHLNKLKGNIALLCHSASVDRNFKHSVKILQDLVGKRLIKIFGPQHGFVTDVQDNMIETEDFIHPYFNIPVHSLYGETRVPTTKMLEGVDTLVVDLQDVGTRVYTYISTLTLAMEKCATLGVKVVVLDRPNPVGGEIIEGTILEDEFKSFVGRYPMPQRHAMTMGEVGYFAKKNFNIDVDYDVVKMTGWKRDMMWEETGLPWVNPSPNLPTSIGALTFVGTVLFEGTKLSEGRGTTRSLEVIGHPSIEPFKFVDYLNEKIENDGSFVLRPVTFHPMFQKHAGLTCGGVHIHPLKQKDFRPWRISQLLCREFKNFLGNEFQWQDAAYEYEYDKMAIDLINGTSEVRHWIERNGDLNELLALEVKGYDAYQSMRNDALIY
ncbi:conserved hypothetical protein [Halobacteriovorax marinus SJ]|uniref:DUF1343 domain-containing protein n=1 Tax=Halobacteriovorax marinus (strain ATCC BAA-682 / DSM 15412 / SJ) TaxID=862908 RepID=E1X1D0_HALMS|nr:DUF1343 domain-containing protein [Halobacteriovorax marinus]CBW26521.1 conserved hypothetical protein [Halobacteriovorax marinus SJ]